MDFKKQCSTETVVGIVVLTALVYLHQGFKHLTFLLDNAKIHGKNMEAGVQQWLADIAQQVALPDYTPQFLAYALLLTTAQSCRIPDP